MRSRSQLQSVGEVRGVTPPASCHLAGETLRSRIRMGALCNSEQCPTKIWMDAYLPAFAIRSGISLVSIDSDFVRFEPPGTPFPVAPSGLGLRSTRWHLLHGDRLKRANQRSLHARWAGGVEKGPASLPACSIPLFSNYLRNKS
jgi:hypothetical protein